MCLGFRLGLIAGLCLLLMSASAFALELGLSGDLSIARGTAQVGLNSISPGLGGEASLRLDEAGRLRLGAFLDHNWLNSSGGASAEVNFYGALARLIFESGESPFIDLKLGWTRTVAGDTSSDALLGAGIGLGYRFMTSFHWRIQPRIGYRMLPYQIGSTSLTRSMIDVGALLSYEF